MEQRSEHGLQGLRNLVGRITPWLFEVGSWIFGGLIAFNLVLVSALITVGPVDSAMRISVTAFACALPLDVAGIFLLRLFKDMEAVGIDEHALRAFQDAGFPDIEAYFPPQAERESSSKRRAHAALGYSLGLALLSAALTLAGLTAAMWHMRWWIAVLFLGAVGLSAVLVIVIIARSLAPESAAEKELKRRYMEYRRRQKSK